MSDNNISIVPDVIKSASEAIQTNFPETAKQTDEVLSTVVGFFNHVVLYPVKKASLTFRYKLEAFGDDMKKKTEDIPDENLQVPPASIAGPILEALRYTYDEEKLREMYENLLASSMDNRKISQAHPFFVDAIRQMSSFDAKLIAEIADYIQLPCARITFAIKGTENIYSNGMPRYFVAELLKLGDPYDISASITNLQRLGLVDVEHNYLLATNYDELANYPYVQNRKKEFDARGIPTEIKLEEFVVSLNDYGYQFATVCLRKEESTHAD